MKFADARNRGRVYLFWTKENEELFTWNVDYSRHAVSSFPVRMSSFLDIVNNRRVLFKNAVCGKEIFNGIAGVPLDIVSFTSSDIYWQSMNRWSEIFVEVRISVRGKKKRVINAMLIFCRVIMPRFSLDFAVHVNKYNRKERRRENLQNCDSRQR